MLLHLTTAAVLKATPGKCCGFCFQGYSNIFLAFCNLFFALRKCIYGVVTEDESVDPEHLERVRKFKADHEASKAKLQKLQNLVDEKRITDNLIKLEKQKLWDAKCKERREDISRKVGESWDIAR